MLMLRAPLRKLPQLFPRESKFLLGTVALRLPLSSVTR
jgi:hypothetical protein